MKYLFSLPNEYVYSDFKISTMDLFFEYILNKNEFVKGNDDIEDIQWIHYKNIDPSLFGLKSISQAIKKYIENPSNFN